MTRQGGRSTTSRRRRICDTSTSSGRPGHEKERRILAGQHISIAFSHAGVPRAVIGAALYLTVLGLFALGLGALIRNAAGATATLMATHLRDPATNQRAPIQSRTRSSANGRRTQPRDHLHPPSTAQARALDRLPQWSAAYPAPRFFSAAATYES